MKINGSNPAPRMKQIAWIAFLLFAAGLAAEVLFKYATAALTVVRADLPDQLNQEACWRRVLSLFGDESLSIWAFPVFGLRLMPLLISDRWMGLLRWLPYFIHFLLPVLYIPLRKKALLLIPAVFSLLQAVGILAVTAEGAVSISMYFTPFHAIPFAVEAILLFLMCFALGGDRKSLLRGLGTAAVAAALLSPLATAMLADLGSMIRTASRMAESGAEYNWGYFLTRSIQYYPYNYAASKWPVFKAAAFGVYALILFYSAGGHLPIPTSKKQPEKEAAK